MANLTQQIVGQSTHEAAAQKIEACVDNVTESIPDIDQKDLVGKALALAGTYILAEGGRKREQKRRANQADLN